MLPFAIENESWNETLYASKLDLVAYIVGGRSTVLICQAFQSLLRSRGLEATPSGPPMLRRAPNPDKSSLTLWRTATILQNPGKTAVLLVLPLYGVPDSKELAKSILLCSLIKATKDAYNQGGL